MINPKRITPRHTIIKIRKSKDKEKYLKQQGKGNKLCAEKNHIRLSPDFLAEIVGHKVWHDEVMKGKSLQSRALYLTRLSLRFDGEIKVLQASKF